MMRCNTIETKKENSEYSNKQKVFGDKGLLCYIVLLSMFVILSTDSYLPALPIMTKYFETTESLMSMTLIMFFVVFAFSSLIWGPFSDKYGRKPMIIIGMVIYLVGTFFCAVSVSAAQLIIFRIVQAVGGSVTITMSTAITKDVFTGKKQEGVIAIVQSVMMVCPVIAPIIGAFVLNFTSWRGIFWLQLILGITVFIGSLLYTETLREKATHSILTSISRLGVVIKNPRFSLLIPIFITVQIGVMAFVGASTYIYQDFFGIDSQQYSFFFAINAVGMMAGPILYIYLSRHITRTQIVNACFLLILIGGVLVVLFGTKGPWIFSFALLPASIVGHCLRPPGTFLMLAQQKKDIGSASSIISFVTSIFGSIGIMIATAAPHMMILTIGIIYVAVAVISGTLWLIFAKSYSD